MEGRKPEAWENWLIAAKLQVPNVSGSIARREWLRDPESQVQPYRLTLVHGPAGYGKTTLLAQWAEDLRAAGRDCAWITFDEDDREFSHVAGYLAFAIGRIAEDPNLESLYADPLVARDLLRVKAAMVRSLMELRRPLFLFLDDYHRAATPDSDALLDFLVGHGPDNFHIVLAGRTRPALPLGSYTARGLLNEMTMTDLAFSQAEAQSFLGESRHHYDMRHLAERFEGWPAGLQLARVWLERSEGRALDHGTVTGRAVDLARYLAEEVYQSLDDPIREFLVATSILPRFNGDLANAVTGRDDGWAMIEEVARQNLFLHSLDATGEWHRYHQIFAEFLAEKLRRENPAAKVEYHRRAAEWLAAAGHYREALAQAQAVGSIEYLAAMLDRLGGWWLMMRAGSAVLSVARELNPRELARYPSLGIGYVYRLAQDGRVGEAREWFRHLSEQTDNFRNVPESFHSGLYSDAQVLGLVLRLYEDSTPSLEELDAFEKQLANEKVTSPIARSLFRNLQCFVLNFHSRYADCIAVGEEAIAGNRQLSIFYAENYIYFFIGLSHLALGRLDAAEATYLRARRRIAETMGPDNIQLALADIFIAECDYERDRLDEAEQLLDRSLDAVIRGDGWVEVSAAGFLTRAAITFAREGARAALDALEDYAAIAEERRQHRLKMLLLAREVAFLARAGAFIEASALRNSAEYRDALHMPVPGRETHWQTADHVARALTFLALAEKDDDPGRHARELRQFAEATGNMRARITAGLLHAVVLRAEGKTKAAAESLVAAVECGYPRGFRRIFLDFGRMFSVIAEDSLSLRGLAPATAEMIRALLSRIEEEARPDEVAPFFQDGAEDDEVLSSREREIVHLVAAGLSSKEIALKLDLALGTVKTYRKRIHRKLGAVSRSDMIAKARAQGILA